MKQILFLLDRMPSKFNIWKLKMKLMVHGVSAKYINICDLTESDAVSGRINNISDLSDFCGVAFNKEYEKSLFVTDSVNVYKLFKEQDKAILIYIHEEKELDLYSGAKYFVMDAEDTDYTYFDRVYRRIHELPWEMYKTKRLIVRETTESDVDEFYEMYKDPRMTKYMEPLYEKLEEERKYVKEYREKVYSCQGFGIWTLVRKSDGKIIGRAGLNYRSAFDEVEIGFAIGSKYWNQGYATEAIDSILKFAKRENLGPVNALVMSGNEASKHVIEKLGFKYKMDTNDGGLDYEVWCCLQ